MFDLVMQGKSVEEVFKQAPSVNNNDDDIELF